MKDANYAVVRVTADPARDEPMNIGVVLWSSSAVYIKVDADAVSEVIRRHRFLTDDALVFIEEYLWSCVAEYSDRSEQLGHALLDFSRFPVSLSEPRSMSVPSDRAASLETMLDRLVRRLVSPSKPTGGRHGIRTEVKKQLRPLVQRSLLKANYQLVSSQSGSPWSVDYFADSGVRFALDVLPLKVNDANEIVRRAAAQAFKFADLAQRNAIDYKVLCDFNTDERFGEANERARSFLKTAGAEVETNLDETVFKIRSLLAMPLEAPGQTENVRQIRSG